MTISSVIQYEGSQDALVWKHPEEDFNTTSQLVVDETHEALLVINGYAADLFGAGRRTLSISNIPLARKLTEIPTGGDSPFPCKVFFVNKVHQMDMLWGTFGSIALEDPLYDIFLHVMANGSMSVSVDNSRKFLLKMVGFRADFDSTELIQKFRGIISSHVKDCISKIMIDGMLSYFIMNAHLFELSEVILNRLENVFEEYGVVIRYFNIETIEVPESDYKAVSEAKEKRTGRLVEGYTWQEERQMLIAEKFASNEGTMGNIGGAVGGFMMGGAFGGSIVDIAHNALNPELIPDEKPPKNASGTKSHVGNSPGRINVNDFFKEKEESNEDMNIISCNHCGASIPANVKFCPECGREAAENSNTIVCPNCSKTVPRGKFCVECGYKFNHTCKYCGAVLVGDAKFCMECGKKI